MDSAHVLLEFRAIDGVEATVAILTLNRPEQLNAIDEDMLGALERTVAEATAQFRTRAILVTGAGRAFCAGGDLKKYESLQRDPVKFPAFVTKLHHVFGQLRGLPIPVIALVNGVTAAGGLELMLNCDIVIASETARIGDGHLNYGQMGGGGVLTLLPRLVGIQRAAELVFSGRFLSAGEAHTWGLVNAVAPPDRLLTSGLALAESIGKKSPEAITNAKYVMNSIWAECVPVAAGLRLERERNAFYCLTSADARDGLAAFSRHETPKFGDRVVGDSDS